MLAFSNDYYGMIFRATQSVELFCAYNRITNDIGNKIILLPQERAISDRLIVQMKDFVKGSVSDAVINLDIKAGNIRQGDSLRIVDRVYKAAFEIMVSTGENE